MKTLFLYLFPLLLMLGGGLFGWLARWYKYGGRCGAGGLADGVPNVDAQSGTVRLDGSEPTVAIDARKAEVAASGRSALDSLKTGYSEGKATGTTPESPADGSTVAKVGAVVGGAAAAVGAGIASASSTVRDAGSSVADSAKSGLASIKDGYSDGKAPGETPDEPADGSVAAKAGAFVGGAVTAVKDTTANAVDSTRSTVASLKDGSAKEKISEAADDAASAVRDTASDAVEGTKSSVAAMKDGYTEGKAPGDTPDAPADGSVAAKVGAAVGGAVTTVKDAATNAVDGTKSSVAAMKEGYAEGKAPGESSDAPADGSVAAKVGAAVGGAVTSVKDTASSAVETTKSKIASVKGDDAEGGDADGKTFLKAPDPAVRGKMPTSAEGAVFDDVPERTPGAANRPSAGATGTAAAMAGVAGVGAAAVAGKSAASDRSLPGATIGQEDGHPIDAVGGTPSGGVGKDTLTSDEREALRLKEGDGELSSHGDDSDRGAVESEVDVPETLSAEEQEAQRLIDSGAEVSKPATALTAPRAGRSPDDLKRIKGIGPKIETTLNGEGIYYYDQIAEFGGHDIAWADKTLAIKGRVVRDRWVPQAQGLAELSAVESEVDLPESLSAEEQEAQRLIDSGAEVSKPASALTAPSAGRSPDDLKRIKGIGPKIETTLNGEGIYYFDQIAEFGGRDIAWADKTLAIKGRVVRDRWVPQAKGLASLSPGGADAGTGAAMRSRFASLSNEAADDAAAGSGMSAGVIDIPDTLSDAEVEANRLLESGETIGKPQNTLAQPEPGRAADDLKLISGIGPKIEGSLNDEGIYYFDQIANFGGRDLAWADQTLGFKGRAVRDRWIPQAKGLAAHRDRSGLGANAGWRGDAGASGGAPANTPLRIAEAEALRLIERDGGYAATSQNRPEALMRDGPVGGKPDDLKRIKGIGEKLETVLNGMGVYYFRQIAGLSAHDIAWVDSKLNFKGRIIRDRWVPQAEMFEKNNKA